MILSDGALKLLQHTFSSIFSRLRLLGLSPIMVSFFISIQIDNSSGEESLAIIH